jgi:hypothetical protein
MFWWVATALVMGWLARTRQRAPERTATGVVMRSPASLLTIGVVIIVFFLGCAIAALATSNDGARLFVCFFGFAMLGAPMIADYYLDRLELREDGFAFRTTWGGKGDAAWSEVTEIKYSQAAKWFRVTLQSGRAVRVSALMIGLPALAEHLLARAPNARIDATTHKLLVETARGNPPSIWM